MRGARPDLRVIEGGDAAAEESARDVNPSVAAEMPPAAPLSLPAELNETWQQIVADLRDRRLWKDSMAGLVTAYVLAQATALRLEIQIATEGAAVQGAGGALKPHPATGLLRSSRETVARLGAELGLTPTARSRKALQAPAGQGSLFDDGFDL